MKKFFLCLIVILLLSCKTIGNSANGRDNTMESENKLSNSFLSLPINYNTPKDIMIIFTGSDWDELSKKAIKNIFTDEFFKKYSECFEVYMVDVLRNNSEISENLLKENYKCFAEYEINDLPAIALETNNADVYALESFQNYVENPSDFEKFLDSKIPNRENIVKLSQNVKNTSGVEHTIAIDAFLNAVKLPYSQRYHSLVFRALESDPKNESGLKKTYLLWATDLKAGQYMSAKNARAAADEFLAIAEDEVFSPMEKQSCYYTAAYFLASEVENTEEVLSLLNKALEISPKSDLAAQIKSAMYSVSKRLHNN